MPALVIAGVGYLVSGAVTAGLGTAAYAGFVGAVAGAAASALVASAFTPSQKSTGPRINDLSVGNSTYGAVIPYLQGHWRIAGSVVWRSVLHETEVRTSQGKMGGGSSSTTYTYSVDVLYELTENVIGGVRRVWRDGKLIYSADESVGAESLLASGESSYWDRFTVYTGGPSQLPDPVYEASVGAEYALAYRTRGTAFIEGLKMEGTQMPNLTFEVYTEGGIRTGTVVMLQHFNDTGVSQYLGLATSPADHTLTSWSEIPAAIGPTWGLQAHGRTGNPEPINRSGILGIAAILGGGGLQLYKTPQGAPAGGGGLDTEFSAAHITMDSSFAIAGDFTFELIHNSGDDAAYATVTTLDMVYAGDQIANGSWNLTSYYTGTGRGYAFGITGGAAVTSGNVTIGVPVRIAFTRQGTTHRLFIDGVLKDTQTGAVRTLASTGMLTVGAWMKGSPPDYDFTTASTDRAPGSYDELMLVDGLALYTDDYTIAAAEYGNASTITIFDPGPELTVETVAGRVLERCDLDASQYDVTALSTITTPVRGMAISQVMPGRGVMETLSTTYYFDGYGGDKIYAQPRAGSPAATIPYDDLGWSTGEIDDPLKLLLKNELELPAFVSLTYSNIDGDYQPDTQNSDRQLSGQESNSAVQVPMVFTASEAKSIADARLTDMLVALLTGSFNLSLEYSRLVPTDVVLVTGVDASVYRMRLMSRKETDGVLSFEAVLDDASVFTQLGLTVGGPTPQTVVSALPSTTLELLDIPILRDSENHAGHYFAVKGANPSWHSATVYQGIADANYLPVATLTNQAVMGTCMTILGNWTGGTVYDESNLLTVNVGKGQLASYTRDDVQNGVAPGYLVGSEIIFALTATLVSTGIYILSSLLRGRRGTEWAMTGHLINERFVALSTSGMGFVMMQTSDLGSEKYYKAVSAGQRLSAVGPKTITPVGVGLECFSPVDLRADRLTANTVLTWIRRTRLSTRIGGTMAQSIPLGEATEAYEVDIFADNTYAVLKRTLTSSTPTVTYTSAQQVTDFGSGQSVLYVRVYQVSADVGRGYPLQAAV